MTTSEQEKNCDSNLHSNLFFVSVLQGQLAMKHARHVRQEPIRQAQVNFRSHHRHLDTYPRCYQTKYPIPFALHYLVALCCFITAHRRLSISFVGFTCTGLENKFSIFSMPTWQGNNCEGQISGPTTAVQPHNNHFSLVSDQFCHMSTRHILLKD